jgi:hypothetical protein
MANFERKYNQQTGGFDYFVDGRQTDQNAYTEANGGNWWNTLSGSNRKEDNILLGSLLEQSGVQDRGASKGVLQAPDFNKIGTAQDQEGFTQRMMKVMEKQSQDVQGEAVLSTLRKRLEGTNVDSEELKNLPVDVRQRVQAGDIAKIAESMGNIRQQMQGRAQAKAQAFDFIVNRYDRAVATAQQERAQELENFRYTLENFGPESFANWKPEQVGRLEMELGIKAGTLNSQIEGSRRVKAEQERLRQEEIARQEAIRKEEQAFRDKQFARQNFESDRAFNASRSDAAFSRSQAVAKAKKPEEYKGKMIKNDKEGGDGGFAFTDPSGKPISMFEYFSNSYGDQNEAIKGMYSTLSNGSADDKQVAKRLASEISKGEISDDFISKHQWLFR